MPLGDQLISIALMHAPKLSLEYAEIIIPLFIGAFLANCGFGEEELENLGSVTPSAKKNMKSEYHNYRKKRYGW